MPRVDWGVGASDVDDFDRESQFKPYAGPIPPNSVYEWVIRKLQFVAATKEKQPSLRVGLALEPRDKSELAYDGYFIMAFLPVTPKTDFRYVPFLDAIGVSGSDFANRTIADEDGNIKKIGRWKNSGEEMIMAQLRDGKDAKGNPQKEIWWMGPMPEGDESPLDDDDVYPSAEDEGYDPDEDLEF